MTGLVFFAPKMLSNTKHILMVCDVYSDLRRPLILKAQICNTDINNLSLEDKFIFIIN